MKVGQLLCGGFLGTTVTPQAYELIVEHHVLTLIISRKNAVSVPQITKLIRDLQSIALNEAQYKYPIMFAIDEEGGMMNTLFDPENLTQYPSAMALSASGDAELIYQVSRAVARELKHIGFLIILGPVLDVVTKLSHQLVSVRSFGTTVEDVSKYGALCAKGLQDGGLFTMGKHFPGIGNATVDSLLELPMIGDSLDQIRQFSTVPFAHLIKEGLLDGMSAAGCGVPAISPDETHACLSPVVLNQLLRQEMGFDGVVVSECLEMDALYHSIGLGQGIVLAISAGCDIVMVCHDLSLQREAIDLMEKAVANGNIDDDILSASLRRIEKLQKRLPPWSEVVPPDEPRLYRIEYPDLWAKHQQISSDIYQKSITLVRDYNDTLPITKFLSSGDNVLLLTPLLYSIYPTKPHPKLYHGEEVFQEFGELLSNHLFSDITPYNVLHTTYTANGLTALHELLIERSKVVIVVTSEATRNMYQVSIVKYVSILCGALPPTVSAKTSSVPHQLAKPLVIVATLLPYDFFYNKSVGSAYLCSYDYTRLGLSKVAGALMGDFEPEGCIPGEAKFKHKRRREVGPRSARSAPKRRWLVDELDLARDWAGVVKLWRNNFSGQSTDHSDDFQSLPNRIDYHSEGFSRKMYGLLASTAKEQVHFVVRNSLLNIIYGVVLTWVEERAAGNVGAIAFLLVDKLKRMQSIGKNLHERAMRYLVKEKGCKNVTLGKSFPLFVMPPAELSNDMENFPRDALAFMNNVGWYIADGTPVKKHIMLLEGLDTWLVPKKIFRELMIVGVRFDICNDPSKLMTLIERYVSDTSDEKVDDVKGEIDERQGIKTLYKEAVKYLANSSAYGVKIIIALEPTNQSVIGSIILFTNRSQLSKFYPFIDECATLDDLIVGGIIGPVIDPLYSNLTEIFKYGLICSGITFLKSNLSEGNGKMDQCVMVGVSDDKAMSGMRDIGFRNWRWYVDSIAERTA